MCITNMSFNFNASLLEHCTSWKSALENDLDFLLALLLESKVPIPGSITLDSVITGGRCGAMAAVVHLTARAAGCGRSCGQGQRPGIPTARAQPGRGSRWAGGTPWGWDHTWKQEQKHIVLIDHSNILLASYPYMPCQTWFLSRLFVFVDLSQMPVIVNWGTNTGISIYSFHLVTTPRITTTSHTYSSRFLKKNKKFHIDAKNSSSIIKRGFWEKALISPQHKTEEQELRANLFSFNLQIKSRWSGDFFCLVSLKSV